MRLWLSEVCACLSCLAPSLFVESVAQSRGTSPWQQGCSPLVCLVTSVQSPVYMSLTPLWLFPGKIIISNYYYIYMLDNKYNLLLLLFPSVSIMCNI